MVKRTKKKVECCVTNEESSCCKVVSIISVDERGQMVLPKEIREKAGIKPGDKLAVISFETKGNVQYISLVKTDDFKDMLKGLLGPMMKELFKS